MIAHILISVFVALICAVSALLMYDVSLWGALACYMLGGWAALLGMGALHRRTARQDEPRQSVA